MEIKQILLDENEISNAIEKIASELNGFYSGYQEVVLVSILKGSIVFTSDLMRKLKFPVGLDFMAASSYGDSTRTSGVVKINKDLDQPIAGKNVLLIEDIVDTGLTISYIRNLLASRSPKTLKICAFLDKPTRRQTELTIDFTGVRIPDKFVVGYGLDWNEKYRNLPYVAVLG
ncbi:hypoxanthine phosphoribosyltransferase [candidate division WOR-3 bacterium]|nr:hypoxanthine phosphoribosyltransferase [candidate division WOR-3 bacterium]